MKAQDIIAEDACRWFVSEFDPQEPDDFDRLAKSVVRALRDAANASPGDSIVIGPDGDVGRLEQQCGYCGYRAHDYTTNICKQVSWLYRVVQP